MNNKIVFNKLIKNTHLQKKKIGEHCDQHNLENLITWKLPHLLLGLV